MRTWTQPYKEYLETLLKGAAEKDKDKDKGTGAAAARKKKAAAADEDIGGFYWVDVCV